jgi:hypothetical protein
MWGWGGRQTVIGYWWKIQREQKRLQFSFFFHLCDVEEEEVVIIDFLFEIFCHSLRQKKREKTEKKI